MSRTLKTTELGCGQRTHKPTQAHLDHVERVKKSEKIRDSIRYNKNVKEGLSSPEYSEEESGGNNASCRTEAVQDDIVRELNDDETYRQVLIARLSKLLKRDDLKNWDVDELEKLRATPVDGREANPNQKSEVKKFFDNTAQVKDNGPARSIIPPPKPTRTRGSATVSGQKRPRSPSSERGEDRPTRKDRNRRVSQYPSPARSTPSAKSRSSVGRSLAPSKKYNKSNISKSRSRSKSNVGEDTPSDAQASEIEEGWEDDDDDRKTEVSTKQKSDRGKRGDFKGVELELLDLTFSILVSTLFRKVPFPTTQQYTQSIYASWDQACTTLKLSRQHNPIQKAHKESIRDRINSLRGCMRDVMKDLFEVVFGFPSGKYSEEEIIEKPDAEPGTGWFAHTWVERAICKVFFMGRHPVAVKFPTDWDLIPHRAVAIVCGFMMYYLDKWKQGKRPDADLPNGKQRVKRMTYFDIYPFYLKQWSFVKRFRDSPDQRDRCMVLLSDMYNNCLKAAGQTRVATDDESADKDSGANDEDEFAMDIPTKEELARVRRRSSTAGSVGGSEQAELEEPNLDAEGHSIDRPDYDEDDGLAHDGVGLGSLEEEDHELNDEDILGPSSREPSESRLIGDSGKSSTNAHKPVPAAVVKNRLAEGRANSGHASNSTAAKQRMEIVINVSGTKQSASARPKGPGPRAARESGRLKVMSSGTAK
ncbi:hypothetical protein RhiJN_20751 [Ceratobasidium sp. AG-Ba]|nr:hypothetical protein RhiJN_20751 [Ceratobasidium sp. AG-Ba]